MVGSLGVSISYAGDGATAVFPYPNYLFALGDLAVMVTDAAGNVTVKTLGTDWTWNGNADSYGAWPNGGNVQFISGAPAAGSTILITRNTARTQNGTFPDGSAMPGTVFEHGLDKLTLIAQEQSSVRGYSSGVPIFAGGNLGDRFYIYPPAPGGIEGWVCTTPGAVGIAVWTQFGLVSGQ